MRVFSRLRRSVALFLCPELRGPVPKLEVVNFGLADFETSFDADRHQHTVVIKPRIICNLIEFQDGSVGAEWGPEDGTRIQRKVEAPQGGLFALPRPPKDDWSACDAAVWARAVPGVRGWTVFHEPKTHHPGARAFVGGKFPQEDGRIPGVISYD